MNKRVYLAGDLLTKGAAMLREKEATDIRSIGFELYNPADNKDINDKETANQDGLAERIVKQDSEAIYDSDILVIEPQSFALGTITELGQVKGRKDLAKEIIEMAGDIEKTSDELVSDIINLVLKVNNQKILPHYEDIRRFKGVNETEDRRSLGINQYVYGVCLDVTDGVGFYEWDEILDELEKQKGAK